MEDFGKLRKLFSVLGSAPDTAGAVFLYNRLSVGCGDLLHSVCSGDMVTQVVDGVDVLLKVIEGSSEVEEPVHLEVTEHVFFHVMHEIIHLLEWFPCTEAGVHGVVLFKINVVWCHY